MKSVFWALVRKDIYLMRGFIIAMAVVGLAALALATQGGKAFAVGGILFLTSNVAGGIFIAIYTVLMERKEQARQFALSLPISGERYDLAKLVGAAASYFIPWSILTIGALAVLGWPGTEYPGLVVYGLMIQGCVLALSWAVLAALFFVRSEAMSGVVILTANIMFSLFMVSINQPEVTAPLRGPTVVWTPFAQQMLAMEVAVIAVSLLIALFAVSRKRDHI